MDEPVVGYFPRAQDEGDGAQWMSTSSVDDGERLLSQPPNLLQTLTEATVISGRLGIMIYCQLSRLGLLTLLSCPAYP